MSLLLSKHDVQLPFKGEHLQSYTLKNNLLLIFSEKWDYIMWDGLRGKVLYQGKFPEAATNSVILGDYSYWFTQISQEKILYYSPTDTKLKVFNFQTATVVHEWSASFTMSLKHNFFNWLGYYPQDKKCRVMHMIDFSKAAIDDVFEDGTVTRIGEVDITNGNCLNEANETLLCGTQANEGSPLVIHAISKDHISKISFNYETNITPVEYGLIRDDLMFILYNHNTEPDTGIYLINIGTHDFTKDLVVKEKGDNCQKITLQDKDDQDIFDGRIIIDKVLQTFTIKGMTKMRVYKLFETEGKYNVERTESRELDGTAGGCPLNNESMVCFDLNAETNVATIGFYRATDTRCLYMWILQASKIADNYNPAILKELIDILV